MQDKEMSDESDVAYENPNEDEDDILYLCPRNSESQEPCSLLFIDQSYDQLQILKWYQT